MIIEIPDLEYESAMKFCRNIDNLYIKNDEAFVTLDFEHVRNCDPFPMLMVASAIRNIRSKHESIPFKAVNCNNDYAKHMKFYGACGIPLGDDVENARGNDNYSCITKLNVDDLYLESSENLDPIQETIEKKSKSMAKVLGRGNKEFESWMAFVIRELLRNIPEHSHSKTIWYCAQYWPTFDLVELSILDEGIGIAASLSESYEYRTLFHDDYEALRLALEPGVSRTFSSEKGSSGSGEWKNSGYGLYMVSQMCAELGASFIISSGNAAIRLTRQRNDIITKCYDTFINGTAIQIRIKPSNSVNYKKIQGEILARGEKMATYKTYSIHSASKSSKGLL